MPTSSDRSTHPMVFPTGNRTAECDEWCAALHLVESHVADFPDGKFFDVDDFMVMGGWRRRGKPMIYLYKHSFTRHYKEQPGDTWSRRTWTTITPVTTEDCLVWTSLLPGLDCGKCHSWTPTDLGFACYGDLV